MAVRIETMLACYFGPETVRVLCERSHVDPCVRNMINLVLHSYLNRHERGNAQRDADRALAQLILALSRGREEILATAVRALERMPAARLFPEGG